ncbi:dihydrolipoamide acetyltransferase family protein [Brachybacterium saurashtrense]|uniref:Dihydrolipoamide acetyltransferase component of pyruvate dehydrogenase complex n=1 Tax=Brachybacterium saurashtrense TaxID=556288 RepID=A0A345YPY8_9MICO|nr:dihydrolipoamide acetyltransferase family protein [Brachybacterium saurashtrense]AXK45990.1 2-oxo acid dehydrogenase subunit E2 [Brachybacterium saurashtrense]RRR23729.1 2-oxo acid dehydrogenase subunit E2 [Brachybacterium saurashtrense]
MNAAAGTAGSPAPSLVTIDLTDPGEGLTEAEILEIKVAVGDRIEINAPVVEVETAKSAVELPSHVAGTVVAILVAVGDEVPVGTPLVQVDTAGGPAPAPSAPAPSAAGASDGAPDPSAQELADQVPVAAEAAAGQEPAPQEPAPAAAAETTRGPANLVGYGERPSAQRRRRRRAEPAQADAAQQVPIDRILAKPPVRKLARDLGIALHEVLATGPEGTVTREDVLAAQQRAIGGDTDAAYFPEESPQAPEGLGGAMKTTRDQAFSGVTSDERTTRVPIRSVRRRTAEAMVASAFTAPHVTVFNEIDMTAAVEIIAQLRTSREWADVKISPLAVIAKALLVAIRRNPEVNASWDEAAQEIVYKHYVNLGIAAATPRGLIVPNLKDAHLMTLRELAEGIGDLARTARAGRTSLRDTRDGTITITNYGVFDIDSGTPILNPGESAILGVGAIKEKPWVVDGQVVPRQVATLSLSFDHRLIDGALGAELLRDVSAVLEQPSLGLVWG